MNARIGAEQTETRADQAHARLKPELAALSKADDEHDARVWRRESSRRWLST